VRLSCPACGFHADVDAFLAERAEQETLALALTLPAPLAASLVQYLRLFRPARRALTAKRVGALLSELVPPIKDARIERNGRAWAAPVVAWQLAIDEMLAKRDAGKLQLPLKSHGYLFEIVAGMAAKAEARAESKDEDRRAGRTPVGAHPAQAVAVESIPAAARPAPEIAQVGLERAKAALRRESTC